jgi:DNA-directed RNA polymerase subunit alpha
MEPIFEVKQETQEQNYGKFVITPLANGYGHTLGQALKRVLLTSIPGAAITTVKIDGVKHQFSTLKGMKEDVLDFLLNLKNVRISYTGDEVAKLTLSAKEGQVLASDIKLPSGVSIANPDLVLATLAKGASLNVEMEVTTGIGYSPADERVSETIGVLPVDAIFSPVLRVNPKIEETRVGRVTNYDKLILEIWTDGTIEPESALNQAANLLASYFGQITNPKVKEVVVEGTVASDDLGSVGKLSVEEIGLPTRVSNALVKSGYDTVEKLVNAPKSELVKVRNLGEKSLKIIKAALAEKGVELKYA